MDNEEIIEELDNEESGSVPSKPHKLPSIGGYIAANTLHHMATGGSGGYSKIETTLSAGIHNITVGAGGSAGTAGNSSSSTSSVDGGNGGLSKVDSYIANGGTGGSAPNSSTYIAGQGGTGTTVNGNNGITATLQCTANTNYNTSYAGGVSVYNSKGEGGGVVFTNNSASLKPGIAGYVKIVVK